MKVIVADSHPTARLGVRTILDGAEDMTIVGEASSGKELIPLVSQRSPNLVVLSLNVGGDGDGIEALQMVKASRAAPRVLIHSAYNFCADVSSCLLAGADGYLHKSVCCEEFLDVVRRVAYGERVWVVDEVGEASSRTRSSLRGPRLTSKEREVVSLMLRRYSNAETAKALHLSLPTVKTHVRNILRKLNAKNRTELFARHLHGAPLLVSTPRSRGPLLETTDADRVAPPRDRLLTVTESANLPPDVRTLPRHR